MNVTFDLNGSTVQLDTPADRRLLSVLHEDCGVVGPKAGCGVGRCGACLVLMNGRPVNACLVVAAKLDGARIETIEVLGDRSAIVRKALAEHGAVQCGYCAPGLVTLLTWLSESRPAEEPIDERTWLSGQICRCTGYGGLRRALASLFP